MTHPRLLLLASLLGMAMAPSCAAPGGGSSSETDDDDDTTAPTVDDDDDDTTSDDDDDIPITDIDDGSEDCKEGYHASEGSCVVDRAPITPDDLGDATGATAETNANGQVRVVDNAASVEFTLNVVDGAVYDPSENPDDCVVAGAADCSIRGYVPAAQTEVIYDTGSALISITDPTSNFYPTLVGANNSGDCKGFADCSVRGKRAPRQAIASALSVFGTVEMSTTASRAIALIQQIDPSFYSRFFLDATDEDTVRDYCLSARQLEAVFGAGDGTGIWLVVRPDEDEEAGWAIDWILPFKADARLVLDDLEARLDDTFHLVIRGAGLPGPVSPPGPLNPSALDGVLDLFFTFNDESGACTPHFDDIDQDGVADADDNCVGQPNTDQADADEDGFGDTCDPQSCPNGEIEAPETCDGGETGCNDGCYDGTSDCLPDCSGYEETCDTGGQACGDQTIQGCEVCDGGAVSCQDGCYAGTSACMGDCTGYAETCDVGTQACGNGLIEGCEACDGPMGPCNDGCYDGTGACLGDCSGFGSCEIGSQACGNAAIEGCELCEDSNPDNTGTDSGCTAAQPNCQPGCAICSSDVCGDSVVGPSEICDDGNTAGSDGCRADCRGLEICGDGQMDVNEACDDGNTASADGCRGDCLGTEDCGDGQLDIGEGCDDGNTVSGDGCRADCNGIENCGDAWLDTVVGEVCDDGNNLSGDGCRIDCLGTEVCPDERLDTVNGEACDDGPGGSCRDDCSGQNFCGDGVVMEAEACDDGFWNGECGLCAQDCKGIAFSGQVHGEDFESGLGSWTTYDADGQGNAWSLNGATSHIMDGTNSAQSIPSLANSSPVLESPALPVPPGIADFFFAQWFQFDDCADPLFTGDGGIVEISTNGGGPGGTWAQLFPQSGYSVDPYVGTCPVAPAIPAYVHQSAAAIMEVAFVDLAPYAAQTVHLRFRAIYDCDNCVVTEGWYVDGVSLQTTCAMPGPPAGCGDALCTPPGENTDLCPMDCPDVCGDGYCSNEEWTNPTPCCFADCGGCP